MANMIIKGDFLRSDYTVSFEKWQEWNEDFIQAINDEDRDLVDSFKWYCKALFHDYEANHSEMKELDKRTRKYKLHLKNKAVCEQIMFISEGFTLDSPEEAIDQMSTEIEKLYEKIPDKDIIMETAYMAQVYVYAAKCQPYYKMPVYIIGQEVEGIPVINGVMVNLHDDILDLKDIEYYNKFSHAKKAMKDDNSCIIRCYPVMLNGDFEPVQVRLAKILEQ
jgi:hypothetical protein